MKYANSRPFTGILDAEAINKIFVAYDIVSIYKQCKKYNIQPVIRPRKYARVYEKVDYLSERNSSISVIKSCESHEKGKERWKKV